MPQLSRPSAAPPIYAAPPPAPRPRPPADSAERRLLALFDRHIEDAVLRLVVRGEVMSVGRGASAGHAERVTLRVHDPRFFRRVLGAGNLGMGESYMDGDWDMEERDIADLLAILLRNRFDRRVQGNVRAALGALRGQFAEIFHQRRWRYARAHFDLGTDLFEAFLDPVTMMYSCGYANTADDTVEQMQVNKLDRICRAVGMKPGDHVLDIGCGFAGLLIHAARHYGVTGVGITTSRDHRDLGGGRIAAAGLADRVRVELRDHRTVSGRFDRVVSLGMFEHLPRAEYGRFFARIAAVLPPHGTGLVHTVGCHAERSGHDRFTQKYMLPGTSQPKLSEIKAACEGQALAVLDVENIVGHYDRTIRGWLARFRANKGGLDPRQYDTRFKRMWEYYLSCAIAGTRASDVAVYQVLFARDRATPMKFQQA